MGNDLFNGAIVLIYALVILWVGGKFFYGKWQKWKESSAKPKNESNSKSEDQNAEGSQKKTLSSIRRIPVDTDRSTSYTHKVAGSFSEIFHIFMSIGPDMVATILKVEKSMVILQGEFEKDNLDTKRVDELMAFMLMALNQLEAASEQLIDRMVDVYFENRQKSDDEVEINPELIQGYITIVNSLEDISNNYTYRLQRLNKSYKTKYPEKLSEFTTISEKLVYVLYVIIACCSNRLDKHINVNVN